MSEPCKLSLYKALTDTKTKIPFFTQKAQVGFPSPAEDQGSVTFVL